MADDVTVRIVADASKVKPGVDEATASFGGLETVIAEIGQWADGLIAKFVEIGSAGKSAGSGISGGMNEARAATEAEGNALTRMVMKVHEGAESVRTFQMRAKEFAELYVALFAVEGIEHWAESLGEAAEKIDHLAAQTGMTKEQIQGLSGAAKMSGSDIDALAKGLGMMDNKALQATASTSSVTKAFKAMGVSANDGATNMQRLMTIADKFHDMADGPTKAALAMQLFGKSGRDMIPFLNQGSAAIEQLMQKSQQLGLVNEKAQEQGERLASSVNEAKVAWDGLKTTLTEAFGPLLTATVDGFTALVAAMHDSYESGGLVKIIFDTIAEVLQGLGEMIGAVALAFQTLFATTSGQGLDWGLIIKTIIEGIVIAFKTVVAIVMFVADAFIAAFHLMKGTAEAFLLGFTEVTGGIRVLGTGLGEFMQAIGKVVWDALHLHWGAIASDWSAGMDQVKAAVTAKANEIMSETARLKNAVKQDFADMLNTGKSFSDFYGKLMAPGQAPAHDNFKFKFGGGTGEAPDISAPGPKGKKGKKGGGKDDLVQNLEEELEAKKNAWNEQQVAQDTAQDYSLQSEADFWQQALNRTDLSAKDRVKIEAKYVAAEMAVQKEAFDQKLELDKEAVTRAGQNAALKATALKKEAKDIADFYGAQSKEAQAANKAVVAAETEAATQLREVHQQEADNARQAMLAGVDAAEASAKAEVEMGRLSQGQMLAMERQFESERYQIEAAALAQKMQLLRNDPTINPTELAKLQGQIEQLERQHQAKLTQIDRQATLERTKLERDAINQVGSGWAQQIAKLATLQQGFMSTLKGLYQTLQQTAASVIESILTKWITAELTKLIYGKTTNESAIAGQAALAGAGGVASMAAAPFPMDMTAPAFGASMSAAAMGFSAMNSFDVGAWNLSQDQVAKVHAGEMVIPAGMADGMRGLFQAAGNDNFRPAANDGGAGGDNHLHLHGAIIHNPAQLQRWFEDNATAVGAGVRQFVRSNGNTGPNRK